MSLESNSLSTLIKERAFMLKAVRSFFDKRNVFEVDTPLLSHAAPIDPYIDILETDAKDDLKGYFHSSPEYAMKKLLARSSADIYQLTHVFRKGEVSFKHQIEFMMLEWYRIGFSLDALLEETRELIELFLGKIAYRICSYKEIFENYLQIDPFKADVEELRTYAKQLGLHAHFTEKQPYLDFLFDHIEKEFSEEKLTFVVDFPKELAFLAKVAKKGNEEVALRFECYYKGLELANGFDELQDSKLQRSRTLAAIEKRKVLQKPLLAIDEQFLDCLDHLPACCGVAVGFDRLMMLKYNASNIKDVTYFGF